MPKPPNRVKHLDFIYVGSERLQHEKAGIIKGRQVNEKAGIIKGRQVNCKDKVSGLTGTRMDYPPSRGPSKHNTAISNSPSVGRRETSDSPPRKPNPVVYAVHTYEAGWQATIFTIQQLGLN
jgi:hypothetical protein